MPEGPEIRRAADRIAKAIDGQRLAEVRFGLPRLRPSAAIADHRPCALERACCSA
ncbi:hypothetical protein [Halochromatium glycolicum]|jgi:formamidopyrimidine-DNA glycosylase|uniref:hypothetical protein n=1 Tax=Halochromatium glycolicum TaxID=85075 RepID=UPI00190A711C|nr:hypothetical protein [Halochromatium glycolicum]